MTNRRVDEMADTNKISCELGRRRWNCLGHLLRREGVNDSFVVLGWAPEYQRARSRPKTVKGKAKEKGKAIWKSWIVAGVATRNRGVGRTI